MFDMRSLLNRNRHRPQYQIAPAHMESLEKTPGMRQKIVLKSRERGTVLKVSALQHRAE